jgi:hypothetical protein
MSALPPKADIVQHDDNVRFVPKADIPHRPETVVLCICSLLSSFEQRSFQGGVEIAPHLSHTLIAILAKEGRRLVVFKNAFAFLVLKQNYPERPNICVSIASELTVIFAPTCPHFHAHLP